MKHASDKIKGIGGKCTHIAPKGFISLPLKSDNELVHKITDLPTVFVPSSPCNIIPP